MLGFNGAETDCGIAHILDILLTNSYGVYIYYFFRLQDISSNSNLPSVLFKLNTCLFYALDKREKKLKHGDKGAATLSTSLECQRGRTNYMHNHTMDKRG